jgi:hypothetical protein
MQPTQQGKELFMLLIQQEMPDSELIAELQERHGGSFGLRPSWDGLPAFCDHSLGVDQPLLG